MEYSGYCMRVDAREGYAEKIKMVLPMAYPAAVAVKHKGKDGENIHYHIVIKSDVKDQAFRVRMKKVFDQGKGNGHMSIKPWDGAIEAISYLFHEDDSAELLVQHNVSDETIAKAKEINRRIKGEVEKARDKAAWRLEEVVYEQFKGKTPERDEIAKALILTALRNNKYVPNDFLLKSMVVKIQFRLLEGDVDKEDRLADGIIWRVFHKWE